MKNLLDYIQYPLVPFLILLLLLLVFLISCKRYILYNYNKRKDAVIKKTDSFLTSLIFISKNEIKVNEQIVVLKSQIPFDNKWCKKIVINQMIQFKKTLRGESSSIIIDIYKKLDLHLYSAALLTDFRYSQKCEGFYQFQHIDYKPAKIIVKTYLGHQNKIIRSNAYACYLTLSEGKIDGVPSLPNEISLLNIIKVMNLFHEKKIKMPKDIDQWLYSPNKSVIRMGIKTMVFYNYRNQEERIISLLNDDDAILRYEAIIACKELFFTNSETQLISLYFHEVENSRIEIIKALKVLGGEKSVAFFEQFILYETNTKFKFLAVDALNSLNAKSMEKISITDEDSKKMLNHINDPYIS